MRDLTARKVELRPVGPDDDAFLIEVYGSTRADELSQLSWDDAQKHTFVKMQSDAQHAHYHGKFPDAAYDVILINGERVGRLYVLRAEDQIRIMDITLLPRCRGVGIGTLLVKTLMGEAAAAKKPLRIFVEHFNRSLRLFERLGFSRVEKIEFNYLLEWRPGD